MRRRLLGTALLAGCAALSCARGVTTLADAPPRAQADSARLMQLVRSLAHDSMAGRAAGSPGGARARQLVMERLTALGVPPLGDGYEQPFQYSRSGRTVSAANVLGVLRGSQWPDRYIVVTAHYDHVGVRDGVVYNGADDNASGTAALLELAGWFVQHRPQHSIVIAALDAEEAGLRGARAFIAGQPVPLKAIVANVNLDMVGRNARNELYAVGTARNPQLRRYVAEAARGAPIRVRFGHDGNVPGEQDWTWLSDQGPFLQAGIPFLYFGEEDHPDYHQPSDDAERLQPRFFAGAVAVIIETVRRLDLDR